MNRAAPSTMRIVAGAAAWWVLFVSRSVLADTAPSMAGLLDARQTDPVADALVVSRLEDWAATERLLLEGAPAGPDAVEPRHGRDTLRYRITLRRGSEPPVQAYFKPDQRSYRDWRGELLAARIAHAIEVPVVPMVQRDFPVELLERATTPSQRRLLDGSVSREGQVRGSLALWVSGLILRIGRLPFSDESIARVLSATHRGNRDAVLATPVWRRMLGMVLLDYLTFNDDRSHNVGMLRRANGPPLLVLFDQGDALLRAGGVRGAADRHFGRLRLFPRRPIEILRSWTRADLERVFTSPPAGPRLGSAGLREVWRRRAIVLDRVARLARNAGGEEVVLVP